MCKTCGCESCKCGREIVDGVCKGCGKPYDECSCKVVSTREDPTTYLL